MKFRVSFAKKQKKGQGTGSNLTQDFLFFCPLSLLYRSYHPPLITFYKGHYLPRSGVYHVRYMNSGWG